MRQIASQRRSLNAGLGFGIYLGTVVPGRWIASLLYPPHEKPRHADARRNRPAALPR